MKTGENLAANTHWTVTLFRFMDFRSLDTDSDKIYPHAWKNRTTDWISMSQKMKQVFLQSSFFFFFLICSHVVTGFSLCNLHSIRSELCAAEQLLLAQTIGSK